MRSAQDPLPPALFRFLVAALVLTIASLAFSLCARSLGYGLPAANAFYYVSGDLFMDFLGFSGRALLIGTPDFFIKPAGEYFMYPAPLIFPTVEFLQFAHAARVFGAFLVVVGLALTGLFYGIIRRAGLAQSAAALLAATVLLTSYPYLYLLQRGNVEVFVWLPLTAGIWCFLKKRYGWAAVLFGLAAALKLYPIIFFGLFLPRVRWKQLALGLASFVGFNVVALWWLGPTIAQAYRWNSTQLQAFGKFYAASVWALGYDHSTFALIKSLTLPWHPDLTPWVRLYTLSVALGCFLLFVFVIRKLPLANQVGCLSILCVTVAPVSYDYTLLNLYAFFTLLVLFAIEGWQQDRNIPGLNLLLGLFAVVLTPDSFVMVAGARFGAQVRCLCLLAMLVILLRIRMPALPSPFRPTHAGEEL